MAAAVRAWHSQHYSALEAQVEPCLSRGQRCAAAIDMLRLGHGRSAARQPRMRLDGQRMVGKKYGDVGAHYPGYSGRGQHYQVADHHDRLGCLRFLIQHPGLSDYLHAVNFTLVLRSALPSHLRIQQVYCDLSYLSYLPARVSWILTICHLQMRLPQIASITAKYVQQTERIMLKREPEQDFPAQRYVCVSDNCTILISSETSLSVEI